MFFYVRTGLIQQSWVYFYTRRTDCGGQLSSCNTEDKCWSVSSNTAPVHLEFTCKNKKEDQVTAGESARSVGRQGCDDDRLLKVHHQMLLQCLSWRKQKRDGRMIFCPILTRFSEHIYYFTFCDTRTIYQVPRNSEQSYSTTLIYFPLFPDP